MENVLYLEKRGMDFTAGETAKSDIGNYRVCTIDECIPGKDGRMYFFEFRLWRDRKQARNTHKITGKPLAHVHWDIVNPQGVAVDTQFTDENGCSYRNVILEEKIYAHNYSYNTADILEIVNCWSTQHYDTIVFVN
jgi:hypothetical protein